MDDNSLRISKIVFRFGVSQSSPPLEVDLKNITILVGPNNSGKSQMLKDIKLWTFKMNVPSKNSDIEAIFTPFKTQPSKSRFGTAVRPRQIEISYPLFESNEPYPMEQAYQLDEFCKNVHNGDINTLDNITRLHTMLIDEKSRFKLIADSPIGDLLMNPTPSFTTNITDKEDLEEIKKIALAYGCL